MNDGVPKDSQHVSKCQGYYETSASRRKEGLKEFWFLKFAEKPKGHSTNVLIWMLKIIPNGIAVDINSTRRCGIPYKNHFLFQFSIGICLWTNLPVEMKQLFERLTFTRHHLHQSQSQFKKWFKVM